MRISELEKQIAYEKMFDILNADTVIIFEDDFILNTNKNEICYGLVRMSITNRYKMLSEIGKINPIGKEQLETFAKDFDKVFEAIKNWEDEIPYNDIETAFKVIREKEEYLEVLEQVENRYKSIDIDGWLKKKSH